MNDIFLKRQMRRFLCHHVSDECGRRDEKPVQVTQSTNIKQPTATTTQRTETNGITTNVEINANFRLHERSLYQQLV